MSFTTATGPRTTGLAVALAGALAFAPGCATDTGTALDSKTVQGAVIGTLGGAAAGAAIDHKKRGRGALIGAAVGGLTGGLIGTYLDRQAAEIDQIADVEVERRGDTLLVLFPGDLLFESGAVTLAPGSYSRLRDFASTLRDYPETDIVVKGHTDSAGSDRFNLELSDQRAEHVRSFLVSEGVSRSRVTSVGFGESTPVASNATAAGRLQNRRVEIEVRPNDQLRERDRLSRDS